MVSKCQQWLLELGNIIWLKLIMKSATPFLSGGTTLILLMTTVKMVQVVWLVRVHLFRLLSVKLSGTHHWTETKYSLLPRSQDVDCKVLEESIVLLILWKFIKRTLMSSKLIKLIYFWFISHLQVDVDLSTVESSKTNGKLSKNSMSKTRLEPSVSQTSVNNVSNASHQETKLVMLWCQLLINSNSMSAWAMIHKVLSPTARKRAFKLKLTLLLDQTPPNLSLAILSPQSEKLIT